MNPPNLDPHHRKGPNQNLRGPNQNQTTVRAPSGSHRAWDYWDYPSSCSNVDWKQLSPPTVPTHRSDSHPDGEDLNQDQDQDLELQVIRKRHQLRYIEERINNSKASLVLKSLGVFGNNSSSQSSDGASARCGPESLRDRVMVILQQRHLPSFFTNAASPKGKGDSSRPTHDLHPLRRRVKMLMKRRPGEPDALPTHNREVPVVSLNPPTSPAKQQNAAGKGFERFLSLLNKGVDINFLSRIVNDDTDDPLAGATLLNTPGCVAETKPSPPIQSQGQRLNSEGLSRPTTEEVWRRQGGRRMSSSSRSKSPAPQKKKQKKDEEREKDEERDRPQMVDDKNKQLQNIVRTLGLNLEVEELSKLSDRTQERLYGRKCDDRQTETESQKRSFHREYSRSSSSSSTSSSSSSSSSRSSSGSSASRSQSPSPDPRSHSAGSRRRPEHRRVGRTDGAMNWDVRRDDRRNDSLDGKQDDSWDGKRDHSRDARRDDGWDGEQDHSWDSSRDVSQNVSRDVSQNVSQNVSRDVSQNVSRDIRRDGRREDAASVYQHMLDYQLQAAQTSTSPSAAEAAYSNYAMTQYSHYVGSPGLASYPYWTPDSASSSLSLGYPDRGTAPDTSYSSNEHIKDLVTLMNPDLAESEGQSGSVSDNRCLRFINTEQAAAKRCLTTVAQYTRNRRGLNSRKKRERKFRHLVKLKYKNRKIQQFLFQTAAANASTQSQAAAQKMEALRRGDDHSEASEDERRQPTEEEIKANLRKKLEAFNQKVKLNNRQPEFSGGSIVQPAPSNTPD